MAGKVVTLEGFPSLLSALGNAGYEVIGPTIGEEAIVYDIVESVEDLPIGWTDNQEAGKYSLSRRNDKALFGYVVGSRTWKHFLFPPQVTLLTINPSDDGLMFTSTPQEPKLRAFLGIRPCELAAIEIQDRVFLENGYSDPIYVTARAGMFTVAVNCAVAGGTCFCTSMGTGPRADDGFDLVLTEIIDDDLHEFIIEVGSDAGEAILESVEGRPLEKADRFRVDAIVQNTAANM
ncbi:MAG: sulfite reductase subunit A, partial [Actinomycetota bacterium]